jgi:hypothetical protein
MKKLLLILLCLPMIGFASFPINNQNELEPSNNECDILFLQNGEEKLVKIIEITTKVIKYKNCNNQDGATISIKKKQVLMIKYKNGTNEIISLDKPAWTPKSVMGRIVLPFIGIFLLIGLIVAVSTA